ncbi:MAG: hypothetical protein A2499_14960 [Stygiobacter sp. RIFOXYC12_FULL_38_8]|nr:MAG: hypothetical protein A2X62_00830 [Stygiobacter sp. GWC2_38_9]OGU85344.1 MAG: hypothetical protein A2279_08295 [Stygiobacter sp. RIFOXYA12_FULL_38_9]OGV07870.1 MAG: hypothetical protein A2299_06880 [Stygiobacter sp. RIFOXYB2_FULL_37_11]OGV11424.1 MAG: hypothetical protein A2237_00705 [Stygiobacter sp. RIFOXYA2_FULL_38_8]OGV12874.1 MAG: hypothetical protein A2440_16715 [Stygiobacter sp. RIFOXYC2_FULL_38_25]OGV27131.1 MAG: hypothetical protein A2499_14960 [Stygiobacter sp. RIFOXYC12_FULL_
MKKSLVFGMFLIAVFLTASAFRFAGRTGEDDKKLNKEFNVKPGGKLNLDLNTGGSIQIEGWEKDVVKVAATINGDDAEDVEFTIDQNGNDVNVTSKYKTREKSRSVDVKLFVTIPKKYNVDYQTMGGTVLISKAEGSFEGQTMGGEIKLSSLKGKVEMKTMGGGINIKNCDLDGKVETMGGAIDVDDLVGTVNLSTMGGSIKQSNVRSRNSEDRNGVTISTMGGEIIVDEAMNGAKVKTMGGGITVNKAAKFVEAETMGGNIEIKEIDGKVKATTMGGNIEVKMTGNPASGDREVYLRSMGGKVYLTVPEKLSMDVEIEIGYDKKHDDVKIESDFDLKLMKDVTKNDSKSYNKKYLIGTGSFNGGKNKLTIKTFGGDVHLKKG